MTRSISLATVAACAVALLASSPSAAAPEYLETPAGQKPRVVITADPELDDSNSLVRYLLYSADFRTVGLVYASSQFHWKGDGKGTALSVPGREYTRFGLDLCPCTSWRWNPDERFIDDAVDAYAQAYANLRVHDRGYPAPEVLRATIRWGNVEFDGEMAKDTPGSELIAALLLDNERSPVYLHAWGGQSTIARALESIEERYKDTPRWPQIRAKVIAKAVIHPSGDQDDTYAKYIGPHWPEIRYRRQADGVPLSYNAQSRVSEEDAAWFSAAWTRAHVSERGPLGALYRVWGDGKQMVKDDRFDYFGIAGKTPQELRAAGYVVWTPVHPQGSFLGEGDTGTFLNLVDNGLRGYRSATLGGWGGYANDAPGASFAVSFTSVEGFASNPGAARPVVRAATHPFLADAQRDFAARLVWATTPRFLAANHPPQIAARGASAIDAHAGSSVTLRVAVKDPDRDAVIIAWRRWDEADSYTGAVDLRVAGGTTASLRIPVDAVAGQTIHVIGAATDAGEPSLTRYERFVITVR